MPFVIFDFETMPDPDVPPPAARAEACSCACDRCGLPASAPRRIAAVPHHLIVAGAALWIDPGRAKVALLGAPPDSEPAIVTAFHKSIVDTRAEVIFVGFNSRAFDLPLVRARAMRHGIPVPRLHADDFADRYRARRHLDLFDAITLYGAASWPSVDGLARIIGWPGKGEIDGRDVAALWSAGERERVQSYVQQDVAQEAAILLRYLLTRGDLTPGSFAAHALHLLELVDSTEALAPLRDRIDRDLFLNTGG